MENAVAFLTITSKYPPGKAVGEIKAIDWKPASLTESPIPYTSQFDPSEIKR